MREFIIVDDPIKKTTKKQIDGIVKWWKRVRGLQPKSFSMGYVITKYQRDDFYDWMMQYRHPKLWMLLRTTNEAPGL